MPARPPATLKNQMPPGSPGGTTALDMHDVVDTLEARANRVSVREMGAIGDGNSHPLSERFSTLAQAQAEYPFATSLSQELDWAGIQKAINLGAGSKRGPAVYVPAGIYVTHGNRLRKWLRMGGDGVLSQLFLKSGSNTNLLGIDDAVEGAWDSIHLHDLLLNGNRAGNATVYDGAWAQGWWRSAVLLLKNTYDNNNMWSSTLQPTGDSHSRFWNLQIIQGAGDGISLFGVGENYFRDIDITLCNGHGYYIWAWDNWISDLSAGAVGGCGFFVKQGQNRFNQCKAFFTGSQLGSFPVGSGEGAGYYVHQDARRVVFTSCELQDSWGHGWEIHGQQITLAGCLSEAPASVKLHHNQGPAGAAYKSGYFVGQNAKDVHMAGCMAADRGVEQWPTTGPTMDYGYRVTGNAADTSIHAHVPDNHWRQGRALIDASGANNVAQINGRFWFGLPTASPGVPGAVWNASGTLRVA